jgi:hypothetical protein
LSCESIRKSSASNKYESYIADIFIELDNCFKYNNQKEEERNVGNSFLFETLVASTSTAEKANLEKIASKYNAIADLLFNQQSSGDEWSEYGEYFKASYNAYKGNQEQLDKYLSRLDEFIRIYQNKKIVLGALSKDNAVALFVASFSDNELLYLPMKLRLNTLDKVSSRELNLTIRDFTGDFRDDLRENIILRLIKNVRVEERRALLDGFREGQLLKAANSGMHDFITLFSDNYPEFIAVISEYVCQVKDIKKETYLQWMQTLYDDNKSYKIAEQGKEQFISNACVLKDGKVQLTLSQLTGEKTVLDLDGNSATVPIYARSNITLAYDEPVALYHNQHLKGVSPGLLGVTEIVPAIRLHYYLQTSSDQQLKDAASVTFDVVTLCAGVGAISTAAKASVKGIRLGLTISNTVSSATSLAATLGSTYFISNYGEDGQNFINALQIISATTGFMDLGYTGVSKLKNIYNKELVTIGKFYKKNGKAMLSKAKEKEIGKITQEIYDNLDDDILKLIDLAEAGDVLLHAPSPQVVAHIANRLVNSGYTLEDIIRINYAASKGWATTEDIVKMQKLVAQYFPIPASGVRMRKILSLADVEAYHLGVNAPAGAKQINGFVTKVEDMNISSAKQLIEDMRLDYLKTKFSNGQGFAAIEYTNPAGNSQLIHPFNRTNITDNIPYTNTGMIGSNSKIIPEYHQGIKSDDFFKLREDAILKIYDANGNMQKMYELLPNNIWKLIK